VCPVLAGMQSGPRMASASLCGLTNVAADKRSDDCATLRAALLLTRSQLNLGVSQPPDFDLTAAVSAGYRLD
jgi:hypothetical protein